MSTGLGNVNIPLSASSKVAPIFNPDNTAADEGSFFVAQSVVAGVANTGTTDTLAKTQLNPNLVILNQWSPAGGVNSMNIYLRYIKITVVTVPTGPASFNYAFWRDNLTAKLTTAGTVLTPSNVNDNGPLSKAYISIGANTTVTGGPNNRQTGAGQIVGAIPVALDQWLFTFGDTMSQGAEIGTTTLVSSRTIACAPQVINPGWFFLMGTYAASYTTASQFAWEIGYIERPQGQ
jgi:hypothetical protein